MVLVYIIHVLYRYQSFLSVLPQTKMNETCHVVAIFISVVEKQRNIDGNMTSQTLIHCNLSHVFYELNSKYKILITIHGNGMFENQKMCIPYINDGTYASI